MRNSCIKIIDSYHSLRNKKKAWKKDFENIFQYKMYRAEISLALFKIAGIWPPISSKGIFTLYNVFNIFALSLTTLFTISNFLYIFMENTDMEEFNDNLFYILALFSGCLKMIVVFTNRGEIIEITDILLNEQFAPRDNDEICIQNEFDTIGR